MIIESSQVTMDASRQFNVEESEKETYREWGKRDNRQQPPPLESQAPISLSDRVTLSKEAIYEHALHQVENILTDLSEEIVPEEVEEEITDPRLLTLRRMIEAFTGKRIKLGQVMEALKRHEHPAAGPSPGQGNSSEKPVERREQGWGISYEYSQSYYEEERITFSAIGSVQTADGKTIDFSLDLSMERSFYSEESINIQAGDPLIDPLVISYSGNASDLTDMKFSFDLDADGQEDRISNVASGSGYLAFDKNEDGIINNGSELFGPSTGDGFDELSAYDEDGNNWIDERDTIYTKLSLWRKEDDGNDSFVSLKEADVGAIYLGNATTQFDIKDSENQLNGRIQKTGIYLKDSGGAGLVQQVDLAV